MNLKMMFSTLTAAALLAGGFAIAADWPQWGGDNSKNMVAPNAGSLPATWEAGKRDDEGKVILDTTKNVKWTAKLGSQSYGNPTIADGRIYVGTNNDAPRDPRFKGDHSLIYCLDEKTGDLVWQFTAPKIGSGKVGDWEYLGICSSPTVDGDRVYFVTNRFEIICVDAKGLADGNDGPFKDEGKYLAGLNTPKPPMKVTDKDADIIWRFDMRDELGVFVHNVTSSSVLVVGDYLYASTSNGVDWGHTNIPNPRSPSLVCLNKKTGELAAEEISGMGNRILHGGWSSPAYGEVDGQGYVFFGGPGGFLYCFEAEPKKDAEGFGYLKEVFRVDGNEPVYRWDKDGKAKRYVRPDGPSEFIATPVFHDGDVFIGIGQDPEHGEGVGNFMRVDVKAAVAAGSQQSVSIDDLALQPEYNKPHPLDVTEKPGVVLWKYGLEMKEDRISSKINRTISTASIADGLVYVGDYAGAVHCIDAKTGEMVWKYDTLSHIWGSTLVADGKVYIGNEDGYVTVFMIDGMAALVKEHSRGLKIKNNITSLGVTDAGGAEHKIEGERMKALVHEIEMPGSVFSSPVAANGVLYIMTGSNLYAVAKE